MKQKEDYAGFYIDDKTRNNEICTDYSKFKNAFLFTLATLLMKIPDEEVKDNYNRA